VGNEKASERLERLALRFVLRLRRKPRRYIFEEFPVSTSRRSGQRISRETVMRSLMMEFVDFGGYEKAQERFGPKIEKWIERHIDLIGEVSFCG
jgi:hypothetical protein